MSAPAWTLVHLFPFNRKTPQFVLRTVERHLSSDATDSSSIRFHRKRGVRHSGLLVPTRTYSYLLGHSCLLVLARTCPHLPADTPFLTLACSVTSLWYRQPLVLTASGTDNPWYPQPLSLQRVCDGPLQVDTLHCATPCAASQSEHQFSPRRSQISPETRCLSNVDTETSSTFTGNSVSLTLSPASTRNSPEIR